MAKGVVLVASFADYSRPVITEFKAVIDALADPVDSTFVAEFQKSTITQPMPGLSLDSVVAESRKLPAHVWKGVAAGWKVSDFRKALLAYTKPALIVWGDKDAYCPLTDQYALRKALKGSTLAVYNGIGHALHWEVPERFQKTWCGLCNPCPQLQKATDMCKLLWRIIDYFCYPDPELQKLKNDLRSSQ